MDCGEEEVSIVLEVVGYPTWLNLGGRDKNRNFIQIPQALKAMRQAETTQVVTSEGEKTYH